MKELANGKAPGLDGVTPEFFKAFWSTIGADYLAMIQQAIQEGAFPSSVVKGLISLLHKGGPIQILGNYRPITLLNTTYKVYAKLIQRRLQPVLMELVSPDQTGFLPLRYILHNILLVQETLTWAKTSHQPLLLMKLDFAKAYDRVS